MVEELIDGTPEGAHDVTSGSLPPLVPRPPGSGGPHGDLPPPPPGGLVPRRPPSRSEFWIVAGSLGAVVLLCWTTLMGVDVLAHGVEDVSWVVSDPVATLVVEHHGDGKVHVIGSPVDDVTIDARVSEGLRSTDYGYTVDGDELEITASCPNYGGTWCSVDYVIEVPVDTDVRISGDATIRVENLAGDVDVSSDNGTVDASGLSGYALLSTDNGSVRATGMRSQVVEASSSNGSVRVTMEVPPRSVIAKSDNGSAEVLVPRTDDAYSVDVDSGGGSRTVDVLSDPLSERRLTARTSNGSARVGYSGT